MPLYEYECTKCKRKFTAIQGIEEKKLKYCKRCDSNTLQRLVSSGVGAVFKGSGFYCNDYGKK